MDTQPAVYELVWRVFKNTRIHEVLYRFQKDKPEPWTPIYDPIFPGNSPYYYDPYDNQFFNIGFPFLPEQGGILRVNGNSDIRIFMDDLYLCPDCGRFHPIRRGWPHISWLGIMCFDVVAMWEAVEQRRNAKEFYIRLCDRRKECAKIVNDFQERIDREAEEERARLAWVAKMEQSQQSDRAPSSITIEPVTEPKPDPCVYLIGGNGYVKIGIATDVKRRLSSLKTSSPLPLKLLKTWNCTDARTTEARLHTKFADFRQSGEWFRLPEDVLNTLIIVDDLTNFLDGTSA